MKKLKVSQVALSLGVSNQTIYNYLSKFRQALEGNLIRENGKQYLTQDGFKILKNCLGKPDSVEVGKSSQNLESLILGLKDTIDNLIRQHAEEKRRSDTIILKLTNDIGSLQKQLEFNPIEPSKASTRKGSLKPSTPASTCTDQRRVVPPPVQRQATAWEGIKMAIDDILGFAFGRG